MTYYYDYASLKEIFRCYFIEIPDLNLIRQIGISSGLKGIMRKISWMACLDILPSPTTPIWGNILKLNREKYEMFIQEDLTTKYDDVIEKDIERLFDEIEFFTEEKTRTAIKRICKVYSKKHPHVGYQQGIHELAGIIYYAFENEKYPQEGKEIISLSKEYEETFQIAIISFPS